MRTVFAVFLVALITEDFSEGLACGSALRQNQYYPYPPSPPVCCYQTKNCYPCIHPVPGSYEVPPQGPCKIELTGMTACPPAPPAAYPDDDDYNGEMGMSSVCCSPQDQDMSSKRCFQYGCFPPNCLECPIPYVDAEFACDDSPGNCRFRCCGRREPYFRFGCYPPL